MASKAESISKATGIPWPEWDAWLTGQGALALPHSDIAKLALGRVHELNITIHQVTGKPFNDGWWSQGIAIEFEHQHGLREQGQSAAGDHAISASRKVVAELDDILLAWRKVVADRDEFDGVARVGEPRISSTEKWRYWRITLADGTAVNVDISLNRIAIQHAKLDSAESGERWRKFWKPLLAEVQVNG